MLQRIMWKPPSGLCQSTSLKSIQRGALHTTNCLLLRQVPYSIWWRYMWTFLPEVETPSTVVQFDTKVEMFDDPTAPPLVPTDDEDSSGNSVPEGVPFPESEGEGVESSVNVEMDDEIYDEDVPFMRRKHCSRSTTAGLRSYVIAQR
mmetsp:Transcript_17941/g.30303  ORF Transcript_17941/g.30303 Transcript_17941/m.30303 type:complete len:147 (-) Transcript_17941:3092-3532(-)